jgi:hypothetical protein
MYQRGKNVVSASSGVDDQIGPPCLGLVHERDHARDHGLTAIGTLDRAHLGGGNIYDTHERPLRLLLSRAAMTKNRAHFCGAYQGSSHRIV